MDGFDEEWLGLPDSTDGAGRTQLLLTAIAEGARDDELDYRMPMAALIDVVNQSEERARDTLDKLVEWPNAGRRFQSR